MRRVAPIKFKKLPQERSGGSLMVSQAADMRRSKSVILVEDDRSVAEMYRLGLELHGFRVTVAGSGDDLFASLESLVPDAIVLDYELPGAKGDEVLEVIRRDDRTRGVVVFMLSNFPAT